MRFQLKGKLFHFYSRNVIKIYTLATIFECFLGHFRKTLKYVWLYYLHNPYCTMIYKYLQRYIYIRFLIIKKHIEVWPNIHILKNPQILSFQSIYYLKSIYFLYQMWIDKVILDSAFLYHENIKDALKFFDVYYKFLLNYYYNIFSFHSYYNKISIVYIHFRLLCVLTNINICQINRLILKNTF